MEISEGIHRIACPFGDRVVYCHLILGEEKKVLVDTGVAYSPEQDIFPYMQSIGMGPEELDLVLITHSDSDHQGGNDIVRRAAPKAAFAAHRLDAPWIESAEALIRGRYSQFEGKHGIGYGEEGKAGIRKDCQSNTPMDWHLAGGERYRIGPDHLISFIHTPGHTWGHTVAFDEKTGTLIAGEAALHKAILGLSGKPALPPTYCYIATYEATLERLLAMEIGTYSPAHWPVMRGNQIQTFLSESLAYCRETEQKVLELLQDSPAPLTLQQIIATLNDSLGTWPKSASQDLAYGLAGHLAWMLSRDLIVEGSQGDTAVYSVN
ncbi:MAG TPA: MBL fold metallo-hydrolase [Anaerolineaceae bacterium]|nr:MBL fold metallo-hydrolase [Anaerolineaceae bacterium]